MTDPVPDTTEAFYVHEVITDPDSEMAPYQAYYGPYSKDYADAFSTDLATRFADREAARTDPSGAAPAPTKRTQALEVVTAATFDASSQANLQPAPEVPTEPTPAPTVDAPASAPATAGPATADPTPAADAPTATASAPTEVPTNVDPAADGGPAAS